MLYTNDASGTLKSFNLLNVSDAFATSRTDGTSESYYFFTEDQRGSTVNVLDNSGNQVVSYWYNDFGEVIESKATGYSSFVNEIQYTGGIYDELTGLLYLNARFYDPSTGRFITQDTYRGDRNNADTWHLYAYCANNPFNYTDHSGNIALPLLYIGVTGIVAVLAYQNAALPLNEDAFRDLNRRRNRLGGDVGEFADQVVEKVLISYFKLNAKPRYKHKDAVHHIVARIAKAAQRSRDMLEDAGLNVEIRQNKVVLRTILHVRLHSKVYHQMVEKSLKEIWLKKQTKRMLAGKFRGKLNEIGKFLESLDKILIV